MKLHTIKNALVQMITNNTENYDWQPAFDALKEVHDTLERATDMDTYKDEVYLISASSLSDLMISNLYETYAKRRKAHGEDFPVSYFQHDARKVLGFEDFTNDQLQIGYDIISDLWADNEAEGNHDENGLLTSKQILEVKLTLSSAECNCILEAIEAANEHVEAGELVYVKDGYKPEDVQKFHADVTTDIANALAAIVEAGETVAIIFEP